MPPFPSEMSYFNGYFSRHDQYLPLHKRPTFSRPSLLTLTLGLLVAIFAVANMVSLFRPVQSWPSPFDDYQALNTFPIINQSSNTSLQNHAIVTTLYSDSYAAAVATLGHSLRKANTNARLVVLYFPDRISPAALCVATSSGFESHPISRIPPPHNSAGMDPHFIDQFTKLALWSLDSLSIDSLIYMDADTLVLRNFDEIFSLPFSFAAVPDVFLDDRGFVITFNAGVLFLKPDTEIFHAMIDVLPVARFPPEYAEQAFLNQFFAPSAVRLPYVYNGNLAYKKRAPKLWEDIRGELRVIHYTIEKPFLGSHFKLLDWETLDERIAEAATSDGGFFRDEMELWGKTWQEARMEYAEKLDRCRRGR
ncbi:hypothetical protein PHLCEN_2v11413 [Hermanssonia centrifuga]|uniref:Glycosyltransferase family 8 protein n=1 Tax=Hermanssonia centrifuga TaxID=98765 RepID=A0A2R6NKG1_9APHY|nr:hypothetical protein PHLCEN_2v11413 [Hermanssonia centrifuga]